MGSPEFYPTVAVFSGGGTGGHLYPALALAEGLRELRPDVRAFFVGAERGVEARILPRRGLEHLLLPVRGFRRDRVWENLGVLWDLLRSLLMTGELFSRLRPGLVVVTGGYACGPAGLVAGLMGIPLALQEQNARPGFTTRVLSRWSRQVHLAFPEAGDQLPVRARSRASVSGNPIRPVERLEAAEARSRFGLKPDARVILVVGGSQGSAALNQAVLELVEGVAAGSLDWPEGAELLWATGPDHLADVEGRLGRAGSPSWVHALGYIHEMEVALSAATLAVSRAGAMTTSELSAWGVPAVFVPLPTAAADHQSQNARALAQEGSALVLPEAEMGGDTLLRTLSSLLDSPDSLASMREAALRVSRPGATESIAWALAGLLPTGSGSRAEQTGRGGS